MDKRKDGLYQKYKVERVDGKELGPCFVMEFNDIHAQVGLVAYANSVKDEFPDLSRDILKQIEQYYQFSEGKI